MREKPTAINTAASAQGTTNMARHPKNVSTRPDTTGATANPTAMAPLFSASRTPSSRFGEMVVSTLVAVG